MGLKNTMDRYVLQPAGILNYIIDPITNGRAEQVNSKIQQLKSISKCYRNFDNFRNAILFYFGEPDPCPQNFPQNPQKYDPFRSCVKKHYERGLKTDVLKALAIEHNFL